MNWDTYLMDFATHAASKSKYVTKVGAVLVGPEGEVRLTAYNGAPRGVEDLPERYVRPEHYLWLSHAEQNLVAFAARYGIKTEGCSVYCTHTPCSACAKSLIQAGVSRIVCGPGKTSMPDDEFRVSRQMLWEAGVSLVFMKAECDDAFDSENPLRNKADS